MPFDLIWFGTAAAGLVASGAAFYRIAEEAGFLDRGISEDLRRTPQQSGRMATRLWEVFWSHGRKVERLIIIGGIATFIVSGIVISAIAS